MKSKSRNISEFLNRCIGHPDEFSIESRIFHAVILMETFILVVDGLMSIAMGLPEIVFFTWGFMPFSWISYYLSRFRNNNLTGIFIFGLTGLLGCIACFFLCGGSEGVTLLLILVVTFVLVIISPKWQIKYWLLSNIIAMMSLLFIEYKHPEFIKPIYDHPGIRLIDQGQAFFMVIVFIALVTYYIKDNYYKEKLKVDRREDDLVTLNEEKNKLFSIVAHDLRAPLASIQNYLELLKQVYLTDEEKDTIQDHLLNSTKSTSEMLTNILSWTKAQMDGVALNFVRFNLSKVMKNTLQVQFHQAKEKGIELIYVDKDDMTLFADPDMMQLVIRNLLNNAIKFTPAGGKIWIIYEQKEAVCLITIKDNGIGIAKEKHKELFSLKSQSTFGTNNEKGVGLGLVLTKNYVELQEGTIWFESEEGQGTTFVLTFSNT